MSIIESFWSPRNNNPPATDEAIRACEERLGRKLPQSFIDVMKIHEGGPVARQVHPGINGLFDAVFSLDRLIDDWDVLHYMDMEDLDEPRGLEQMVQICGTGHYYVCLDYGRGTADEPVVTFADIELFEPAVILAPNFAAFIEQLQDDIED